MPRRGGVLQGINYRSETAYNLLALLKLGTAYHSRFNIAAQYINPGDRVLDFCSGPGQLKEFLPPTCAYECIEPSASFVKILRGKNIHAIPLDLHRGLAGASLTADAVTMLISLAQFRNTSLHELLEGFKRIGKRVVIVEDVLQKRRRKDSIVQRTINYLCATDYFLPMELFTSDEFESLMARHGYTCVRHSGRYIAAVHPGEGRP